MSAHRRSGIAHLRTAGMAAAVVIASVNIERPRAQDRATVVLLELTGSSHPLVRGEAAVLLAAIAPEHAEDAARKTAADRDPRARPLGLLAIGILAPAGAEAVLGNAFEGAERDAPERFAAAYALGRLPGSQSVPALDRFLATADGGNYRRNRDALAAIVLGLSERPHPMRRASLQRLLDDAANRDGPLRALVIRALAAAGDPISGAELERRLGAEWPAVRLATIDAVAGEPRPAAGLVDRIAAVASSDADPQVRARALGALVELRHASVVELADSAVHDDAIDAAAAGVAATLLLGGGTRRAELAAEIAAAREPSRQAAMLAAWKGPAPEPVTDAAFELATSHRRGTAERAIATHVLAREGDPRAVPLLRALLVDSEDGDTLTRIVSDLAALDADEDVAHRLRIDGTDSLRKLAPRLEALFRLGRPEALELLCQAIQDDRIGGGARAELLRAWRRAVVPPADAQSLEALPRSLRELLR